MSVQKGKVLSLSARTKSIQEAVDVCVQLGQLEVSVGDISGLTRIDRKTVGSIMAVKTRAGCFIRVQCGRYRIVVGAKIARHLPAAFVAIKAWDALNANQDRFLTYSEVAMEVETMAGQRDLCLKDQVCVILRRWHRSGYLDRNGKAGHYSYRILPGIASRPPLED